MMWQSKPQISFASRMEMIKPSVFLKEVNTDKFRNILLDYICEENFLGAGREARTYRINGYSDIVLRIPKTTKSPIIDNLEFKQTKKFPTKYNYGQTVYSTDDRIEIKELVKGEVISCIDAPYKIASKEKVGKEEAVKTFELLKACADFPIQTYVDLANKIKFLHSTPKTIDYFGSGNILADFDKKEFNIIDLWDKGKFGSTGEIGFANMCSLLCGAVLSEEMHEVLNYDKEYACLIKKVIEKSAKASQLVGLPYAKDEVLSVITCANDLTLKRANIDCEFLRRYSWFFDRYGI